MKLLDIKWLALVALLMGTAWVQAAESSNSDYRIDLTIARDGSLVARPVVEVKAGTQAEVRNEDPLKPDSGFRILVTMSPLDFASPSGKESVKLDVEFFGQHDGKWVTRGKHSVTAVLGRLLSFGFPPSKDETNGKKFELTIMPNRASADAPKPN